MDTYIVLLDTLVTSQQCCQEPLFLKCIGWREQIKSDKSSREPFSTTRVTFARVNLLDFLLRVGRTARGNNKGTALSLVAIKENERAAAVEADLKERQGSADVFKPFQFKMEELDGFRYTGLSLKMS